jgi:hypothetical protein
MRDKSIREFKDSDDDYFLWLNNHPDGFVLNAPRLNPGSDMVLHKATCLSISEYKDSGEQGGFTERQYIKICSDHKALIEDWVRRLGEPVSAIRQSHYCLNDEWGFD